MDGKAFLARRILALLDERGWSKSDLARRMFGSYVDKNGHRVAYRRDRVTAWTHGRHWPGKDNLRHLAEVFGVGVADLVPPKTQPRSAADLAATGKPWAKFTLRPAPGQPGRMQLTVEGGGPPQFARKVFSCFEQIMGAGGADQGNGPPPMRAPGGEG